MLEESVATVPSIWASMNSWFTPTVLFIFLNLMIVTIAITSSLATSTNNNKPQSEQQKQEKLAQTEHRHQLARSPSVLQRLKSINFYSYRSQQEPTTLTYELKTHQEFDSHFSTSYQQTPPPSSQDYYHQQQPPSLARSPSVLQRLKSINLYSYLSPEPTMTAASQKTQETNAHDFTPQQSYREQKQAEEEEHEEGGGVEEEDDEFQEQGQETLDEIYSRLKGNKVSRSKSDTKPSSGEVPKKLAKKMKKSASAKSAFAHFEEDDIVEARRPATVREGKPKMTEEDDAEVDARADDFINKFKQQLKLQRIDSIIRYKEMIDRGTDK